MNEPKKSILLIFKNGRSSVRLKFQLFKIYIPRKQINVIMWDIIIL